MARLESGDLALEVSVTNIDPVWDYYHDIRFLWKNRTLIEPEVGDVSENGTVCATGMPITSVIENLLETGKSDYWEAMEPTVKLGFFPDMMFPFKEPYSRSLNITRDKSRRDAWDEYLAVREKAGGKLPEDVFTIVALVDAFVLEGFGGFWNQGPAFIVTCCRPNLEAFCNDLKKEYTEQDYYFKNYRLQVDRYAFQKAVLDLSGSRRGTKTDRMVLSYQDGCLKIRMGGSEASLRAEGNWREEITAPSSALFDYSYYEESTYPVEIRVVKDKLHISDNSVEIYADNPDM